MNTDELYMRRALQLARNGMPYAFPNPMVGAVIVGPDGDIIGEGYHRRCGEGHAEVNAINSVKRTELLKQSTIYVTLEPCAHYGRTGPCSQLIIDRGIPNVVVGCRDPFDKVDGKGIEMMRSAGINVRVGVLEDECRSLNAVFFTAHTRKRPFVYLKWAQSRDGYIDCRRDKSEPAPRISSCLTQTLTHQLRALADGILVGSQTIINDNPLLDNRLWPGKSPRPIIWDLRHRVTDDYRVSDRDPLIIDDAMSVNELLDKLYQSGMTSIIVEGGATTLQSFIDSGLWDVARVEVGSNTMGKNGRTEAPTIPHLQPDKVNEIQGQIIEYYVKNPLTHVKNL